MTRILGETVSVLPFPSDFQMDCTCSMNPNNRNNNTPESDHYSLGKNQNVEFSTNRFRPMCIALKDGDLEQNKWDVDVDYIGESESLGSSDELDIEVLYQPDISPAFIVNPIKGYALSCKQTLDMNYCQDKIDRHGTKSISKAYFQGDSNAIMKSKNVKYSQEDKNKVDIYFNPGEEYPADIHVTSPNCLDITNAKIKNTDKIKETHEKGEENDWEISVHQEIRHVVKQGKTYEWEVSTNFEHAVKPMPELRERDMSIPDLVSKKSESGSAPVKNMQLNELLGSKNLKRPYKAVNKPSPPKIAAKKRPSLDKPMLPAGLRERKKEDHVRTIKSEPFQKVFGPTGRSDLKSNKMKTDKSEESKNKLDKSHPPKLIKPIQQQEKSKLYKFLEEDSTGIHYFFLVPVCSTSAVGDVLDPIIAKLMYSNDAKDLDISRQINVRDRRIVSTEVSTGCRIYLPEGDKSIWFRGIQCYRVGIRGNTFDDIATALEMLNSVVPQLIHRSIFPEKIKGLTRGWPNPNLCPIVRYYPKPIVFLRNPFVQTKHCAADRKTVCLLRDLPTIYCAQTTKHMNQSCICKEQGLSFNAKCESCNRPFQDTNNGFNEHFNLSTQSSETPITSFTQDIYVVVPDSESTTGICEIITNEKLAKETFQLRIDDDYFISSSFENDSSLVRSNQTVNNYMHHRDIRSSFPLSKTNLGDGVSDEDKYNKANISKTDQIQSSQDSQNMKDSTLDKCTALEEVPSCNISENVKSKLNDTDPKSTHNEFQSTSQENIQSHENDQSKFQEKFNLSSKGITDSDTSKSNHSKIQAQKRMLPLENCDLESNNYAFQISKSKSLGIKSEVQPSHNIKLLVAESENISVLECSLTDHSVRLFRHTPDGDLKCERLKAISEKFKLTLIKSEAVSSHQNERIVRTYLTFENYHKLLKAFKIIASLL